MLCPFSVYIEPTEACAKMSFHFGASSQATRSWAIKIAQYSCDYDNLAPKGCLQYHFGSETGTVKSFNYDGGLHLANQDQNICVRREINYCAVCWSAASKAFDVSSKGDPDVGVSGVSEKCCGYGTSGEYFKTLHPFPSPERSDFLYKPDHFWCKMWSLSRINSFKQSLKFGIRDGAACTFI